MDTKNPILKTLSFSFEKNLVLTTALRQEKLARATRRLRKIIETYEQETEGLVYFVSTHGIEVTFRPDESRDWDMALFMSRKITNALRADNLALQQIVIAPLSVVSPQHYEEINKPKKQDGTNDPELNFPTQE